MSALKMMIKCLICLSILFVSQLRATDPGVQSVVAGGQHSLALCTDGTILAWGSNLYGQLGIPDMLPQSSVPVQVVDSQSTAFGNATAIGAGTVHSLALKDDGTKQGNGSVFAWGNNQFGQLGIGDMHKGSSSVPLQVEVKDGGTLSNVQAIAGGNYFSLALKSDGTLWGWGHNSSGQLGHAEGQADAFAAVQINFPSETIIRTIAAGGQHALAIDSTGALWAWGDNSDGQLGNGNQTSSSTPAQVMYNESSSLSNVKAIAAGSNHSLALLDNGEILAWGDNSAGQLGNGTTKLQKFPVYVGTYTPPGMSQMPLKGVSAIAGGGNNSFAVLDNGTVWGCGDNAYGQVGTKGPNTGVVPYAQQIDVLALVPPDEVVPLTNATAVSCGGQGYFLVITSGTKTPRGPITVIAGGNNSNGQLGIQEGYPSVAFGMPVFLDSTAVGVINIAGGGDFSLALTTAGTVFAWGGNNFGQLGNNTKNSSKVAVQVQTTDGVSLGDIKAIAAGNAHALALKNDGTVWCWGSNNYDQLGNQIVMNSPIAIQVEIGVDTFLENVIAIAAGENHSLALKSDGTVCAWGLNSKGQLGNGSTNSPSSVPVMVKSGQQSGSTDLSDIIAIAGGGNSSFALTSGGTVFAWGDNKNGELGNSNILNPSSLPVQVGTQKTSSEPFQALPNVKSIGAGSSGTNTFVITLTCDGKLYTWGSNSNGQLGIGTSGGSVNYPSLVNRPLGFLDVIAIAGAGSHALAAEGAGGKVWAWGNNASGQVGNGSVLNPVDSPVYVEVDNKPTYLEGIKAVTGGVSYSCALGSNGTIWAWGLNTSGQLGNGGDKSSFFAVANVFTPQITSVEIKPGQIVESDNPVQLTLSSNIPNAEMTWTIASTNLRGGTNCSEKCSDVIKDTFIIQDIKLPASATYTITPASPGGLLPFYTSGPPLVLKVTVTPKPPEECDN